MINIIATTKRLLAHKLQAQHARIIELEDRDRKSDYVINEFMDMRNAALKRAKNAEARRDYWKRNARLLWRELQTQRGNSLLWRRRAERAETQAKINLDGWKISGREVERAQAEAKAYKADFDAELAGAGEIRVLLGARENETFWTFAERLKTELDIVHELADMLRAYRDEEHDNALDQGCDAGNFDGGSPETCDHCKMLRNVAAVDTLLKKVGLEP